MQQKAALSLAQFFLILYSYNIYNDQSLLCMLCSAVYILHFNNTNTNTFLKQLLVFYTL